MAVSSEEINRKLLHVGAGCIIPSILLYLPYMYPTIPWIATYVLGGLLILSLGVEFLRFRSAKTQAFFHWAVGSMLRSSEKNQLTGSTWMIGSAVLCSILFHKTPYISFIVLNLFIFGDGVAAIVGQSIGRIKIGKKSLEGSLGCFAFSVIMCLGVYPFLPYVLDSYGGQMGIVRGVGVSFVITLFELFTPRFGRVTINDNLTVPLIAAFILKYDFFIL